MSKQTLAYFYPQLSDKKNVNNVEEYLCVVNQLSIFVSDSAVNAIIGNDYRNSLTYFVDIRKVLIEINL